MSETKKRFTFVGYLAQILGVKESYLIDKLGIEDDGRLINVNQVMKNKDLIQDIVSQEKLTESVIRHRIDQIEPEFLYLRSVLPADEGVDLEYFAKMIRIDKDTLMDRMRKDGLVSGNTQSRLAAKLGFFCVTQYGPDKFSFWGNSKGA